MNNDHNYSIFMQTLLMYSNSKEKNIALKEWEYMSSFIENNYCICGIAIKENCLIRNKYNGNELIVGNVCIKKFMNIDNDFIFKGINSLLKNKISNNDFILYCYEKGYLYENQKDFLINKYRKRKFTKKQADFKDKILLKLKLKTKY